MNPSSLTQSKYYQPFELVLFHVIAIRIKYLKCFYYPHLLNNYLINYLIFSGLTLPHSNLLSPASIDHNPFPRTISFESSCLGGKDLSPLFLKELRVKTLVNRSLVTLLSNKSKQRAKHPSPVHCLAQAREYNT